MMTSRPYQPGQQVLFFPSYDHHDTFDPQDGLPATFERYLSLSTTWDAVVKIHESGRTKYALLRELTPALDPESIETFLNGCP